MPLKNQPVGTRSSLLRRISKTISTGVPYTHARQIRAEFRPKAAGLYNLQNKLVSSSQRATTFADYLSKKYGILLEIL